MPSKLTDALFSEPSGRPQALVLLAGALVLSSLVFYGHVFGDTTLIGSLTMTVSFALSGVAESLPVERRRAAGGLRVTAILLLLCLVGAVVITPDYVV